MSVDARFHPVKQFLPYYQHIKAVKWPFFGGVMCGVIYALASGLGLPLMTKLVFPVLFHATSNEGKSYEIWIRNLLGSISEDRLLLVTCLWIPFIFLIRAISGYLNAYLIQYSGLRILEAIRTDMFIKLQKLPLSFFRKNRSGDLMARVMSDTGVLKQVLAQGSSDLIKQPATLLSALGFLGYMALKDRSIFIALIALFTVPLCVSVIRAAGKRLAARARALQIRNGDLTATLTESLLSPVEIRAFNLENRQIENFRERIREMLKLALKVVKYRQAISPSIEVVASAGFAAALFFGVKNGMKLEGFMTLGMALYMSYEPIKKLGNIHTLFRQGAASVERIEYILLEPDDLLDPPIPKPLDALVQSIRFDHLTFAYKDEPVLRDIDVEIPIGQVVALIGPSGAGKSTFASLIPRFYDPQSGSVRMDGTDIRDFAKNDLRGKIAIVPQMPALFNGTIAENIRIGRLDASEAEVIEAARKAHADEFISTLPGGLGYKTQVGERGALLSGGQCQRIAIARAFLRDAPILVLDEATSALDSESETMVQLALADLVKGRTTFIIAHRFSTITIADRVLVFENGRIVADGGHKQLRAENAIYQSMMGGRA